MTILSTPDAPISSGDVSECDSGQTLTASATTGNQTEFITWYDAATGGNVVSDPSLTGVGTITYYAEATDDDTGCTSSTRTAVTLTILSTPDAPIGNSVQSFCEPITISDLSVSGSNILWYDAPEGGSLISPSSSISDGQVIYASQTVGQCEGINRLEINIEINIIPNPILISSNLDFCLSSQSTLSDIQISWDNFNNQGFVIEWYDSLFGGNFLDSNTLIEDDTSYYATIYDSVSGCESITRIEVVPNLIPCQVIIYNALSLNDNGINDYMVIENVEYFTDNRLEIYNRDGHLLFSQNQYGVADNLFRGFANASGIYDNNKKLPTGSYLYIFKYYNSFEQKQITLKGFLTINSN